MTPALPDVADEPKSDQAAAIQDSAVPKPPEKSVDAEAAVLPKPPKADDQTVASAPPPPQQLKPEPAQPELGKAGV